MKKVIVKRRHFNHPWVFSNEIIRVDDNARAGDVVLVEERKKVIGTGFYNPHSLITVRLFSEIAQDFNQEFIHQKIVRANEFRRGLGESYRMLYSESDGLPGFIVDKYKDYLVTQINSLGMELHKEIIYKSLIEEFSPMGIYEKAEPGLRKLEGLEPINNIIYGDIPEVIEIEQDGIRFFVNIVCGQKTGFFFDQRENRQKLQELARGDILDCFCYTGGFSLYTADKGNVLGLDSSKMAIEYARKNAELNNLSNCQFECQDVFDALNNYKVSLGITGCVPQH